MFDAKEVKLLIKEFDKLWEKYESNKYCGSCGVSGVPTLKPAINKFISKNKKVIKQKIRNGTKPDVWALALIGNLAGNYLESGNFHLHRGVLNPLNGGEALLQIYFDTLDESVKLDDISQEFCDENKNQILINIRNAG